MSDPIRQVPRYSPLRVVLAVLVSSWLLDDLDPGHQIWRVKQLLAEVVPVAPKPITLRRWYVEHDPDAPPYILMNECGVRIHGGGLYLYPQSVQLDSITIGSGHCDEPLYPGMNDATLRDVLGMPAVFQVCHAEFGEIQAEEGDR